MLKYSIKYAPDDDHTISHWKTKKLHTLGGGTPPPPPPPPRSLARYARSHNYIFSSKQPPPLGETGDATIFTLFKYLGCITYDTR